MKLYFLIGLPTETDEDTLGIAELARNCVALGRRHTRAGVGDGERRRVRPQAAHAVPVVRAEHRRRAAAQGRPAAQRHCTRRADVNLKWHDPAATVAEGDPQPRRPPHRARRSSGSGAPAARSRSGASTSTCGRWTDALEAEGLSLDWYVHRHRDRAEVLPWDHLTAGLHEDFLWDDWQAALAGRRLEDCRWTPCYDCGVCTGYGIEHVVASPVAPAGGSQGTGQDLPGGRRPSRRRCWRHAPMKLRVALLEARQDPLHEPPRHGAGVGAGDAPGRRARRHQRRVHAPAPAQLRPGPADGRRVGGRVPRPRRRSTM